MIWCVRLISTWCETVYVDCLSLVVGDMTNFDYKWRDKRKYLPWTQKLRSVEDFAKVF